MYVSPIDRGGTIVWCQNLWWMKCAVTLPPFVIPTRMTHDVPFWTLEIHLSCKVWTKWDISMITEHNETVTHIQARLTHVQSLLYCNMLFFMKITCFYHVSHVWQPKMWPNKSAGTLPIGGYVPTTCISLWQKKRAKLFGAANYGLRFVTGRFNFEKPLEKCVFLKTQFLSILSD